MARVGKIARLPLRLREELNERLRDNENGQTLLAWLNGHPDVQAVLQAQFAGEPINDQNLSNWRSGGFADWMEDQDRVHKIEKLSELSLRVAKAAGGDLSEGLLPVAAGKLLEAMEAGVDLIPGEEGEDPKVVGVSVDKLAKALASIRKMELDAHRLNLDRQKVEQSAQALALETKKFQRTTAALFIEYAADQKARDIATSDMSADGKLEALGRHLFGDAWD